MPHVIQRRHNSASSTVLPSIYDDVKSDEPLRPRRRRATQQVNINTCSGRWTIIIALTILLSIICIFFGSKTQSALNNVHQDEQADASIHIDSPRDVGIHRTLPLSEFSDLTYALENSDLVALYFAASWCPMSTPISHSLDTTYGENDTLPLNRDGTRKPLSIVYVSSDKTNDEFNRYIRNRNWIAVPYESPQRNLLKRHFSTCAQRELVELGIDRMHEIPTIIVIDGATHGVITFNGVNDVTNMREKALNHWKDIQGWIRTAQNKVI